MPAAFFIRQFVDDPVIVDGGGLGYPANQSDFFHDYTLLFISQSFFNGLIQPKQIFLFYPGLKPGSNYICPLQIIYHERLL